MDPQSARRVLGVAPGASVAELRSAYRTALMAAHPDVASDGGNPLVTAEIVTAFRTLRDAIEPPAPPGNLRVDLVRDAHLGVSLDGDTVAADLPAGDLYEMLVDVASSIGSVGHADAAAGMLEFTCDVPGFGPCSVLLSLQGRSSGVTEAFCTATALNGRPAPPADRVAALLAAGLEALIEARR